MSADHTETVHNILDQLKNAAQGGDVPVGKLAETFGHRGYGPFLLIPALIELTPIGGVPGIPTLLALIILLFSVQMLFGREHMWLPEFLRTRRIPGHKLEAGVDKLRPIAGWLDHRFHNRLERFTGTRFVKIAAIVCIVLALTVPPLEMVPFASSAPMLAIVAFGLALLVNDGLLMLVAFILSMLAFGGGLGLLG